MDRLNTLKLKLGLMNFVCLWEGTDLQKFKSDFSREIDIAIKRDVDLHIMNANSINHSKED